MAVDSASEASEINFIVHQTCRLCTRNIDEMQSIPIFIETGNATPETILNGFSFLKLKVKCLTLCTVLW